MEFRAQKLFSAVAAGLLGLAPAAAQPPATPPRQPVSRAERTSQPETIHVRLTLDDAIYAAQNQSIAAMVAKYTFLSAYWSFRSFQPAGCRRST